MKTERIEIRVSEDFCHQLDEWRFKNLPYSSRSEALRIMFERYLALEAEESIKPSKMENLITTLLCNLCLGENKFLNNQEIKFIRKCVASGDHWAIEEEMDEVFGSKTRNTAVVQEVFDILAMWDIVERSINRLTEDDKEQLIEISKTKPFWTSFKGFDGNEESEYLAVAEMIIRDLNRFEYFKDLYLNAHTNTLDCYRPMLAKFKQMKQSFLGRLLYFDEILLILEAQY